MEITAEHMIVPTSAVTLGPTSDNFAHARTKGSRTRDLRAHARTHARRHAHTCAALYVSFSIFSLKPDNFLNLVEIAFQYKARSETVEAVISLSTQSDFFWIDKVCFPSISKANSWRADESDGGLGAFPSTQPDNDGLRHELLGDVCLLERALTC